MLSTTDTVLDLFRFVVGVVSISTTKYAGILKALELPLSLFFWSIICLSSFLPIMTKNPTQRHAGDTGTKHWESIIAKLLTACVISTAFFLAEKFCIRLIAINFHKVQFEIRITENKWAVSMLTKLLSYSRQMFPSFEGEFLEEDHKLEPAAFTGLRKMRGSRSTSTGNATPMMFLNGARRVLQVGAGIVGAVGQEVSGKPAAEYSISTYSVVVEALLYPNRCDALARRIWLAFVQEGHDALLPEDMLDVFDVSEAELAEAAFTYFDEDLNGDVSLQEMLMKIQEVSKERKAIAASLKDTDSAIGKLDDVLVVIVGIISIFTFIALLDTSFKTLLTTSATFLISLSFVFGTTCQEIMASLIFLFIKHPFDVSDRVNINSQQYIVQEMSLMFTILKRVDGTQVQAPNSLLNTLFIENVRRSAAMSETVTLTIDFATSFETVEALQQEMLEFVTRESRDFQSTFDVTISEFSSLSKMTITVSIKHKANWQNDALRAQRRNKWMCALALAIKKLNIVAGGPASGDPANPFVISRVETKKDDISSSTLPKVRDSKDTMKSASSSTSFDPTFGSKDQHLKAFDVDLRHEGESEVVNVRLPFTIAEENEAMVADEVARQDDSASRTSATAARTATTTTSSGMTELERQGSQTSRLTNMISRNLTGRRSNTSSRRQKPDEEQR